MTRILVIEDEKEIRENIIQILELNNHETIFADNGQSGLDLAVKNLPDLIVCDVMMPCMDGYEFLENLRKLEETVTIPCILVTAKVEKKDFRQGMGLGADDYLTKPFTPQELLEAIESRLQRHENITEQFKNKLKENEQNITEIKQEIKEKKKQSKANEDLIAMKDNIIDKLLTNLSDPINNINLAVKMLIEADSEEKQQLYLKILQDECAKEIALLNETKELQKLLTTETIGMLQKFNLLK
ncbi:response regulator transcription factor [Geminocystis sp. CENA526]|uniref:response regulator transcription factor n=1 Tax=Geminocystis sp. CENA526 TaxID=1355871 RepID=UPI003D6F13BB